MWKKTSRGGGVKGVNKGATWEAIRGDGSENAPDRNCVREKCPESLRKVYYIAAITVFLAILAASVRLHFSRNTTKSLASAGISLSNWCENGLSRTLHSLTFSFLFSLSLSFLFSFYLLYLCLFFAFFIILSPIKNFHEHIWGLILHPNCTGCNTGQVNYWDVIQQSRIGARFIK